MYTFIRIYYLSCILCNSVSLYGIQVLYQVVLDRAWKDLKIDLVLRKNQGTTNHTVQRKYRLSKDTGMPMSINYGTEKSFAHIEINLPVQLQ